MRSGVETPQIEQPVYQPNQMAVPPQPHGQPSELLPPQAGYVSKAGAGAFVANNILQGFLKGREIRQQRELAKAQNQMQGADYAYQTLAQNYNDLLRQGKQENDPDVQRAKQAASTAWQTKLQVMGQYTSPAEQPRSHKKSAGQKIEGAFGNIFGKSGVTPQMIPAAALQVLQNSPPPGLGLTPQDKQSMAATRASEAQATASEASIPVYQAQAEKAKMDLETAKQGQRYDQILLKPANTWTPEDKQYAAQYKKREELKKPEDQQYADGVFQAINAGQQLDPTQRQFAYAHGILTAPQVVQYDDGLTHYIARVDADGKILDRTKVGHVYHEDAVSNAVRLNEAMHNIRVRDLVQGGMSPVEAKRASILEESKNPMLLDAMLNNGGVSMQQLAMNDKILRSLKEEAGKAGGSVDEKRQKLAMWSNFMVPSADNDETGYYALREPKPLKDGKYAGGLDATQLQQQKDAFYRRYRAKAQELYPKLTSTEIDSLMNQQLGGKQDNQMTAPPAAAPGFFSSLFAGLFNKQSEQYSGQAQMTPPPTAQKTALGQNKPGSKLYNVSTDAGPQPTYLTAQQLQELQDAHVQVEPAGQ